MYKDARDEYVVCVGARPPRGGRDKPGVRSPTEYNTIYNTKSISNTIQYKYNLNPMSITLRECFAGDENIRCDATRQVDDRQRNRGPAARPPPRVSAQAQILR